MVRGVPRREAAVDPPVQFARLGRQRIQRDGRRPNERGRAGGWGVGDGGAARVGSGGAHSPREGARERTFAESNAPLVGCSGGLGGLQPREVASHRGEGVSRSCRLVSGKARGSHPHANPRLWLGEAGAGPGRAPEVDARGVPQAHGMVHGAVDLVVPRLLRPQLVAAWLACGYDHPAHVIPHPGGVTELHL